MLRIVQTRKIIIIISLDSNETEVTLGPEDGLETNQKYMYTLTAINAIGNVTSHQDGKDFC